jgi:hypothetical protein
MCSGRFHQKSSTSLSLPKFPEESFVRKNFFRFGGRGNLILFWKFFHFSFPKNKKFSDWGEIPLVLSIITALGPVSIVD